MLVPGQRGAEVAGGIQAANQLALQKGVCPGCSRWVTDVRTVASAPAAGSEAGGTLGKGWKGLPWSPRRNAALPTP